MTLTEALSFADEVKSRRHQPVARTAFKKQQAGTMTDKITAGVTALAKSYRAMGGTLVKAKAQLSQIAADVEYIENFTPNSPIRRFYA